MDELKQLKSVLRSLVVSSPTQMTLAALMRDYRNMMGSHLPIQKYGYRDALQFLKERCGDCFLGIGQNTVLTPIVPECLKHIDDMVHKQKVSAKLKFKCKRRSVQEHVIQPSPKTQPNLIVETFEENKSGLRPSLDETPSTNGLSNGTPRTSRAVFGAKQQEQTPMTGTPTLGVKVQPPTNDDTYLPNKYKSTANLIEYNKENRRQDADLPSEDSYKNFRRTRLLRHESAQDLHDKNSYKDSDSGKYTNESDKRTLSSSSSSKAAKLEELKAELVQLVEDSPDGVCCTDLMKLYRQRYGRELNFSRFGYTCVSVLACSLAGVYVWRDRDGELRLSPQPDPAACPPSAPPRRPQLHSAPLSRAASVTVAGEDDALPWIDFDPDVFPEDCMSFCDSIPSSSLEGIEPGAVIELMVGEVYSPSHFWLYRLGEQYNIAMEDMMDEMTIYYKNGEGAERTLAVGAVRVGHYCSSVYEGDWHRSLIVKVLDSEQVKVRHVDYGTVDRAPVGRLKPLLRRWSGLPAQAVRARLAYCRPVALGRRWPHAACAAFLRLVQDKQLVGSIVHVDHEENIVELVLVDTADPSQDVRIHEELIRAGHADPRDIVAPAAPEVETYLYPRFDALESGDTPNFADIHAYLRDGIALDYVDDYRRHVPPVAPPAPAPSAAPLAPPGPAPATTAGLLCTRIPLIPSLIDTHDTAYNMQSVSEQLTEIYSDSDSPNENDTSHNAESNEDLSEPDETRHVEPADSAVAETPAEEKASVKEALLVNVTESRVDVTSANSCRAVTSGDGAGTRDAPTPVTATPPRTVGSAGKRAEVAPSVGKPEGRAAPRARSHARAQGAPLFQQLPLAPSMPALPFFVFPPGPPMSPYPPFPMAPPFPPAPYPSPPRCFPSPRPPYPGPEFPFPPFSSGAVFVSTPTFSPPRSYPPAPAAPTPAISAAPTPATSPPGAARPTSTAPCSDGSRRITTGQGEVTLSVSECEIFSLLSSVDPNAAHWYIVDAISRARAASPGSSTRTVEARSAPQTSAQPSELGSRLNPDASEFRLAAATQTDPLLTQTDPLLTPPPPARPPPNLQPPPGFWDV